MEIIDKSNRKFLKLELIPVSQKEKQFYITKIPAKYFLDLYTVEPAEYDLEKEIAFASEFTDDKDYYQYLTTEDREQIELKAFERKENKNRVKEIKDFLINEEYPLFPNTIIVTCDLINDFINVSPETKFDDIIKHLNESDKEKNLSFLELRNEKYFLYIPYIKNSILIIDGQHRVRGLEEVKDKPFIENFDLLVSFIIGFDRSILAKLFYTINYTQKSVNKSLLYHLSGEFSLELDEITFMHETVKILNELEYSPFYKRIKMLGTIPKDISQLDKDKMTISQAFFIDYLVGTISERSYRSIHKPIFLYYYKQKNLQIKIIRFIIRYFNSIKEIFKSDWDSPKSSVISKTISVGAFLRVLHFFFIKLFIDEFNMDHKKIIEISKEEIIKKLKGVEKIDFSNKGEYGGVGGAGSLNKLKKDLILNIEYFEASNYEEFLKLFKINYLNKFQNLM